MSEQHVLREYQNRIIGNVHKAFLTNQRVLIVAATGSGKTQCFSFIARDYLAKGRVLVLAHRDELIQQACSRLRVITDVLPTVEKADQWSDEESMHGKPPLVVSSIQTQATGRMNRFKPSEFALVIADECHHCVSESWSRVLNYYAQNPNCKILGVTATPDRADGEMLGQMFQTVADTYSITDAIDDGYLVPVKPVAIEIEGLDFSKVHTIAGDFNQGELEEAMMFEEPLHGVAHATIELACGLPQDTLRPLLNDPDRRAKLSAILAGRIPQKCLIFCVSVAHAERMAEILDRWIPEQSVVVSGKLADEDRAKYLKQFATGEKRFLCNCMIACLDEQTEILTTDGWVGHKEISFEHKIAAWDKGRITFDAPLAIEVRDRKPDEKMVVLETPRRSIRVTDQHRMLWKNRGTKEYQVSLAEEIAGMQCDLPINGEADPLEIVPEQEALLDRARRVQANSYALRKSGLNFSASVAEAERRIDERTMQYAAPHELTEAECEFIGFWLGDGTRQKLKTGGVEYLLWQAESCPNLCRWIDATLAVCGFDWITRMKKPRRDGGSRVVQWSLCRGTGFGSQKRRGVYRIEPYLDKKGSRLLWGLSKAQFAAVIRGFWMADGTLHKDAVVPKPDAWNICNTNRKLLDLLQAVGSCRGYRVNIGHTSCNENRGHKTLWIMHVSCRQQHSMTTHRLQFEDGWKAEKVWCVKSTSGFIVTRRRGTVTVMGNTEGFDCPSVEIVVMARPTKSRSLYAQMLGRGTRPADNVAHRLGELATADDRVAMIAASEKPFMRALDFVGNTGRHDLVGCVDIFADGYEDEEIERAKEIAADGETSAMDALEESREEIEQKRREAEQRRKEMEEKRRRQAQESARQGLVGAAAYKIQVVNEWDDIPDTILAKHANIFRKAKVPLADVANMSREQHGELARKIVMHWQMGLCSYKQAKLLSRRGWPKHELEHTTFENASVCIDAIARSGWRLNYGQWRAQQGQQTFA